MIFRTRARVCAGASVRFVGAPFAFAVPRPEALRPRLAAVRTGSGFDGRARFMGFT